MSVFLCKISKFDGSKILKSMLEYNHSKGNENIIKTTEKYSKITDFKSTKKPLKMIEYNQKTTTTNNNLHIGKNFKEESL